MNEAFAPALTFADAIEGREPARLVPLHGQDRMDEEANVHAAFAQFAQHRIDQEGHVVVEDIEHGHAGCKACRCERDLGGAGPAF